MEVKYKGFLLIRPSKKKDWWQVRFTKERIVRDYWADEDEWGCLPLKTEKSTHIIADMVGGLEAAKRTVDEFLMCPRWVKAKQGFFEQGIHNFEADYKDLAKKLSKGLISEDQFEVEMTALLIEKEKFLKKS